MFPQASDCDLMKGGAKGTVVSEMARATEGKATVLLGGRLSTLEQTLEGSPTRSFSEISGAM